MGQVAESYGGFVDDMVDGLGKDAKMPKTIMESNDVVTYLDGWRMSIATQRAKERQNRTRE